MTQHGPGRRFSIGDVIARGSQVYFRNLATFVPLSLVAYIPAWIGLAVIGEAAVFDPTAPGAGGAIMLLLSMIASYWLQAALVYGTISSMRGHPAGFSEMLSQALAALAGVILLAIVISLLVSLGLLLFIVPGIVVMVMFFVAIPAAVVERGGIRASLARSRELTAGHRWSVFALIVVMFFIMMAIGSIVGLLVGAGGGQPGLAGLWLNEILGMFVGGIWATITAVAYHDLRIAREGGDTDGIARAFH